MQEPFEENETGQSFAYEIKGNSAVIWRCFSRDTKAEIPPQIEGYPVTEIAPYAFSAHMDGRELEKQVRIGKVRVYLNAIMRSEMQEAANHPATADEACAPDRQMGQKGKEIRIGKLPVLCGNQIEEAVFPDSVRRVGRYCFYNCGNLHKLSFSGELSDWGSGVFTGCHQIKKLRVHAEKEGKLYLKDMLDELMEELEVDLIEYLQAEPEVNPAKSGEPEMQNLYAKLWFPEFYEEGVENTPARILETHVHGSGMRYRNCFQGRKFDFAQYDVLFPHAVAQESGTFLARMVIGRLRYPVGLSQKAKSQYEDYAKEHAQEFAQYLVEGRDVEGIEWLLALTEGANDNLVSFMTELASRAQLAEVMSHLMNYRRMHTKAVHRRFEL